MKKLVLAVVSLALCACAFGCAVGPDKSGPISAIESYYSALNKGDFDGMIASCDSTTAAALNGSMGLLSGILSSSGGSQVDVKSLIASLYPSIAAAASSQDVTYEFIPKDYNVSFDGETRATVRYTVDAKVNSAGNVQTISQAQEYSVIKEGDTWKIDLSDQLASAFGSAFNIAGSLF